MVVDMFADGCGATVVGAGLDNRWLKEIDCGSSAGNGAQSTDDGAASVTMSYTFDPDVAGIIAVDLAAVSAPARIIRLRGKVQIWGGTHFR
jgi:hypothetical protein